MIVTIDIERNIDYRDSQVGKESKSRPEARAKLNRLAEAADVLVNLSFPSDDDDCRLDSSPSFQSARTSYSNFSARHDDVT